MAIKLAPQQSQVLATVRQFPRSTLPLLSDCSLIPRRVLSRRLPELVRLGMIIKDDDGLYSIAQDCESS